jgi:hypothetical protein
MVSAESGEVVVDGLNGVPLSLTPEAAELLGRRLIAAAEDARRQQPPARELDGIEKDRARPGSAGERGPTAGRLAEFGAYIRADGWGSVPSRAISGAHAGRR